MSRRRLNYLFVAVAIISICAGVYYREQLFPSHPLGEVVKQPEPPKSPQPGTPIDDATVEAWKKAGFKLTSPWSDTDGALPTFGLADNVSWRDITDATLAGLPDVRVPFGIKWIHRFTDAGLTHLARHKYLTSLDLSSMDVTDAELPQLVAWKNLRSLDLEYTKVTAAGLQKHLPELKHLTTLNLDRSHLTDDVMGVLAENKLLPALLRGLAQRFMKPNYNTLNLAGAPITDEGLKHLAGLRDLTYLDLEGTGVRGEGFKHLKPLRKLTTLKVSQRKDIVGTDGYRNEFTDEMLHGLVEAGLLHAMQTLGHTPRALGPGRNRSTSDEEITYLHLNRTQVTDAGLKYLAGLTNLRELDLEDTQINGTGFQHLAGLTNLRSLHLWGTKVTGTGFQYLAGHRNLTAINLLDCPVTEEGLKHIGGIENLARLDLRGYTITSQGVRHLAPLKKLGPLLITPQRMTDEVLAALVDTGLLRALTAKLIAGEVPGPDSYEFPKDLDGIPNLNLIGWGITDDGLKHLAALKNLQSLSVGVDFRGEQELRSGVTGKGFRHLVGLKHLVSVSFHGPQITDASFADIAVLPNLTSLEIDSFEKVSREGLKQLAALKKLAELRIYKHGGSFSKEDVAELQKALPACKVRCF